MNLHELLVRNQALFQDLRNKLGDSEALDAVEKDVIRLLASKGDDYSTQDRLAIFYEIGAMTNQNPMTAILMLIALKVSRISNLLKEGKTPNNESVLDSSIDLTVYSVLLNAALNR